MENIRQLFYINYFPIHKPFSFVSPVLSSIFQNPPHSHQISKPKAEENPKMPVAEVFLGAFLQVLFDRLASPKLLEFATRVGIDSRLKKLEDNLYMINSVITRAEKVLVRETGVDKWLEEIRDWAYDADDFLDEVNTKAMQAEEEEARRNNTSSSSSVSGWLSVGFKFNSGKYSETVDELNSRLDAFCERMTKMHILMKMTTTDNQYTGPPAKLRRPLEATAHAFDARVFGREQEKERIIEQLHSRDENVEVIAIVGMVGIGKSTLARHVYESVKPPLFDIKAWVCVSNDFDVNRITRKILESFPYSASNSSELSQLQSELKAAVEGKRFLIVLDDVWSRNYREDWDILRSPFGVGAPGSKILVTTRDDGVASIMQTDDPTKIHHPIPLCHDDCWSVFLQHVVDKTNSVFESEAGRFRKKILDKCKGLPLAAKLLAGLFRGESPGQGWEAKLNSSVWDISENELSGREGSRIPAVVMLSYVHLPPKLQRCFSYCAVFPEDHEFKEEDVVMMWIAQGLVSAEGGDQVEVTGANHFRELVSRSLFQLSPNKPHRFLMHDLINDMAKIVAGKSCFRFDGYGKISSSPAQVRYSSYSHFYGLKTEFESFERTKKVRALQSFSYLHSSFLTSYVPLELLMKLKYLRVLCLSNYQVRELPEDIGDLIHLRLVDLSYTYIRRLPESTSSLYNLVALRLQGCWRLRTLPTQMKKLVNLRYLEIFGPNKLVAMPVEMGKLTSLQKLSNFIVGKGLERGVGQLKYLSHLKESISISFLENIRDSKEAREAKLMSKEGLQSLKLKWSSDLGDSHSTGVSFHVFEELQPHKHLEKLIIDGYGGLSFPGWVGDDMFSKMRVIKLANCGKCTKLPPLGKLPALAEVRIQKMGGIVDVGEEFYGKERGAFPSLKILRFVDMKNWSNWCYPAGGGCCFACLQELHVINCPKLSLYLRDDISVQKLRVRKCDKLLIALPRHSILEMDIGECKLVECLEKDEDSSQLLPSVTSLNIENVDVVDAHHQMMMLGSITALVIESNPKLTHLPGVVLQGLSKLEKLSVCWCAQLTSLWTMDEIGGLIIGKHFLNSLRVLEVKECRQLDCLVVTQRGEEDNTDTGISEEREEERRGKQQCLGLPCGLETLVLRSCDKLEKLPSDLHNLTSLRSLDIRHCGRMSSLPDMGVPCTLESLIIMSCKSLTCLSSSSSMGGNGMPLPRSLKYLKIYGCENLESIVSAAFTSADSFPSLEVVEIDDWPKLKSLPECIHRRLKTMRMTGCQNLGELFISSVHHLPDTAPNDEQFFSVPFPSSLTQLMISTFKKLSTEAFQNLTSLRILCISQCQELTSTPDQLLLPSSLLSLQIGDCPGLTSIPDQLLPLSLRQLIVRDCPDLTSFPDQSLPASLNCLHISGCPHLTSHFAKVKGRYWPAVEFIADVTINHRCIFDPEGEDEEEYPSHPMLYF